MFLSPSPRSVSPRPEHVPRPPSRSEFLLRDTLRRADEYDRRMSPSHPHPRRAIHLLAIGIIALVLTHPQGIPEHSSLNFCGSGRPPLFYITPQQRLPRDSNHGTHPAVLCTNHPQEWGRSKSQRCVLSTFCSVCTHMLIFTRPCLLLPELVCS